MTATEQLKEIKPGKNYPACVKITENGPEGKPAEVKFLLQSYSVGMYCAIYFPGDSMPCQTGDYDNKKFVGKLVKDIKRAIARGAEVVIEGIRPIKTEP